jgi:hypothetical protein
LLAAVITMAGCDTSTGGGGGGGTSPATHLIGGTIGSASNAKVFFADRVGNPPGSSSRSVGGPNRAVSAEPVALEGKIEDGDFAITLKGTYDEATGKFLLGAMSQGLGIGYSIEGFIKNDGPKDVKAFVKTKSGETWTETEVEVTFDKTAQVSETAEVDTGLDGLPAAWTGFYPLPDAEKTMMAENIDAMFFGVNEGTNEPNATGLGAQLADSIFYAVGPWGLSMQADFAGIDAGIDRFLQNQQDLADMTAEEKAEGKKFVHMTLSQNLSTCYFSFLEIEEINDTTRHVVAFMLVPGGSSDGDPGAPAMIAEKKYFTKIKMEYNSGTNELTLTRANGLSLNETERVPLYGYDDQGNIIRALDGDGNQIMEECEFTSEGVAATAGEARAANNFEVTTDGDGNSNQIVLRK